MGIKNVYVTDATTGDTQGVDSLGHADVVSHAHSAFGVFHIETGDLTASTDFITIDLSDTTNYPHDFTGWLHLMWLSISVDANASADYVVDFGFLENVDATDGDFYVLGQILGSKTAGQSKEQFFAFNPEGPKLRSQNVVSSNTSLNDTAFQTDVNLRDTRTPLVANTPSGSGDMVMRVTITAGTIDITATGAYHSHA